MARAILTHAALLLGGLFIVRLSLKFLDLREWQRGRGLWPARHAKACQALYTLDKSSPWKWKFPDFWVPWWKFTKFLMSFLKPWVSFSSNFAWHFSVMKDNYSVTFRSNVIYFPQKGPIKVQITKTFECLDQNAPNSCNFLITNCFFFKFCITLLSKSYSKKYRRVISQDTEKWWKI